MPYIEQKDREKYKGIMKLIEGQELINSPGELNYFITKVCKIYLKQLGLKYTNINEIMGVLNCVAFEFYRKMAAGYEDHKENLNGEV